ncbi:hypothetical protein [Desulfohalovibrio reitneri]|uniref:hypothetical protein n=1 Tax=Desulfohalovibrio reitneri TaxID=1307759 RepID=UPI0004A75263|nr:hypothetical protein [Desulfohalovibrio reitneri]
MTRTLSLTSALAFFLVLLLAGLAAAQGQVSIRGWEEGSRYNRYYDPERYESLKGELVEFFDVKPLDGMTTGLGVVMDTREGERITIHLGPKGFLDFVPVGFKPGDRIKVKGAFAEIDGRRVFMAAKIRLKELFEVKMRSSETGRPYWGLSEAELVKEELED